MSNRVGLSIGFVATIASLATVVGCASAGRQAAWDQQSKPAVQQGGGGSTDAVETLAVEAEAHWSKRDDKRELLQAIAAWEKLTALDSSNAETLTKLSRAYYFLVDGFVNIESPADVDEQRLALHTKGAAYGEKALMAADPKFAATMRKGGDFIEAIGKIEVPAVPAAYWYCTNLGRFAKAKGLRSKLFHKDRIAAGMKRVKAIAPGYFYAAADRYLGAFYSALPGIAGKDLDKSARHFESAIAASPQYLGNFVIKAEFLAVEKDDEKLFKAMLTKVLEGADGDDPNIAPENRAAKRTAKKLLSPESIDDKF